MLGGRQIIRAINPLEDFFLKTRVKIFLATVVVEVAKEIEKKRNPLVKSQRERLIDEFFPIDVRTERLKIISVVDDVIHFRNEKMDSDIEARIGDEVYLHWQFDGLE